MPTVAALRQVALRRMSGGRLRWCGAHATPVGVSCSPSRSYNDEAAAISDHRGYPMDRWTGVELERRHPARGAGERSGLEPSLVAEACHRIHVFEGGPSAVAPVDPVVRDSGDDGEVACAPPPRSASSSTARPRAEVEGSDHRHRPQSSGEAPRRRPVRQPGGEYRNLDRARPVGHVGSASSGCSPENSRYSGTSTSTSSAA